MIGFNTESNASLLQQVQNKQESILEKLSSGKRINSAADGAAAQQIIDRLTTQVEGNRQSISNSFDLLYSLMASSRFPHRNWE